MWLIFLHEQLKTTSLRVDQAQLTGESESVNKDIDIPQLAENIVQAKTNMLFATTVVVNGIARGLVVQTGMHTEIGTIQQAVQQAAQEDDSTPLKKKLDEFGNMLSWVIGVICVLVWAINYHHFFDPQFGSVVNGCIYYFKIAIALAVAAIPEGLPTTCLALGELLVKVFTDHECYVVAVVVLLLTDVFDSSYTSSLI